MKKHIVVALVSVFFCASARAQLKFEQNVVEVHPAAGDKEAVGHFKYENTGKTPIHFTSVKTSCGCTVAQTQKDEVKPGEKGEITATFKIGDHTGTQVKTVTVVTDQLANTPTILTLRTVLPEMLTLTPTFVFWTAGEAPKPKTIAVRAGKDFAAKNLTVTSSNPEFLTKVESAGDGQWKVNVEPKSTARAVSTSLVVQSDFPKDAPKKFYANASVTGAPVQQPQPAPATAAMSPAVK